MAAAIAGAVLDPDLELFVPGKRVYSIPALKTNATGFDVNVVYGVDEEGFQTYGFEGSWTNPGTPHFKGVQIIHSMPDDPFHRILAIESEGSTKFITDQWTLPSTVEQPRIYAVSIDHTNRSEPITRSTPKVDLQVDRAKWVRIPARNRAGFNTAALRSEPVSTAEAAAEFEMLRGVR